MTRSTTAGEPDGDRRLAVAHDRHAARTRRPWRPSRRCWRTWPSGSRPRPGRRSKPPGPDLLASARLQPDGRGWTSSARITGSSALGGAASRRRSTRRARGIRASRAEADAAAVLDRAGRLEQEQALGRRRRHDPPAQGLPGQDVVIDSRGVAAQGQSQAVLAGRGAVAGPRVAALPGQDGLDVVAEAPGRRRRSKSSTEIAAGAVWPSDGRRERGQPVADGRRPTRRASTVATSGIVDRERRLAGPVADPGLAVPGFDQEPLAGLRAVEPGRGGQQADLGGRECPCEQRTAAEAEPRSESRSVTGRRFRGQRSVGFRVGRASWHVWRRDLRWSSEQFLDRLDAVVDQPDAGGPAGRAARSPRSMPRPW